MTQKVTFDGKATLFWLLLCAGMLDAQALGLGRLQGTALIGRPLDVSVQIQTDPGEDSAALCLDVEVFHADARQDQRLVRVTLEAVPAGQIANARIVSSSPVDEPVVAVLLSAGCAQKSTRRYVLLANPPADLPVPVVALLSPVTLSEPVASALNGQPLAPTILAAPAALPPVPVAKPASVPIPPIPVAAPVAPPVTPQVNVPFAGVPVRAAPPAGSRLTLSPAVPHPERVDTPVAADSEAAAAQKIQTLERDMKAALARSVRLEASLSDMKSRLQQAESDRWPSALLYGLVVLVLSCLLAIGWLWSRLRRLQAERDDGWRFSVMNQAEPTAELDRSKAPTMTPTMTSTMAVATAATDAAASQPSPAPASASVSVQSVDVQPEPVRDGTEPMQHHPAPLAAPAPAAAEPSLNLDNLIDFDPSQGKQPPPASS
jgi:hypothetical protein